MSILGNCLTHTMYYIPFVKYFHLKFIMELNHLIKVMLPIRPLRHIMNIIYVTRNCFPFKVFLHNITPATESSSYNIKFLLLLVRNSFPMDIIRLALLYCTRKLFTKNVFLKAMVKPSGWRQITLMCYHISGNLSVWKYFRLKCLCDLIFA